MTDKATPSPASADSVMAKAMMLVGALDDSCEEATSLPFLEAVTALRAEVERLAAQSAQAPAQAVQAVQEAPAVRMLTMEEIKSAWGAGLFDAGIDYQVRQAIKAFCAVNAGRTIPPSGEIGGAA